MEQNRSQLFKQISDYLFASYRWGCMGSPAGIEPKPLGLSIDLVEYQRTFHPFYRQLCEENGITERKSSLLDYPRVPVQAFDCDAFCPFPPDRTIMAFRTNEKDNNNRGMHRFRDPGLAQRSLVYAFTMFMTHAIAPKTRVFSLVKPFSCDPHSASGHLVSMLSDVLGAAGSAAFVDEATGDIDFDALFCAIQTAQKDDIPFHLMGSRKSFEKLIQAAGTNTFKSPERSCVMELDDLNASASMPQDGERRDALARALGIDRRAIYGALCIPQISSQAYEISAMNTAGELPDEGLYLFPNWVKCFIINPETNAPVLPENEGQIALFDLCSLDSAAFVLTKATGKLVTLDEAVRSRAPGHPRFALRITHNGQ